MKVQTCITCMIYSVTRLHDMACIVSAFTDYPGRVKPSTANDENHDGTNKS